MKISKSALVLLAGIIAILVYINIGNTSELTFDAARHACNAHFYYDYFRTCLSGRITSVPNFLDEYAQKGYNIGWYVLYDPPVFGVSQAIVFLFLGDSKFNEKFTNQLFVVLAIIFIYLIGRKILGKKNYAVACALLYGVLPFNYQYARNGYDPLPMVAFFLGWFYFFFIREPKNLRLRLSKNFSFSLNYNILISGVFFTLASFVKYQTAIYVAAFGIVYGVYLIIVAYKKTKSSSFRALFVDSGFLELAKNMIIIGVILLILGGWWLKFSLIDNHMSEKMSWVFQNASEGFGYPNDWPYNPIPIRWLERSTIMWVSMLFYTAFLLPFLLLNFFRKDRRALLVNLTPALIFIGTVYVISSFLVTDHKFRYAAHVLPLTFIMVFAGIVWLYEYLREHLQFNYWGFVFAFVLLCPVVFVNHQVVGYETTIYGYGTQNDQLVSYFKSLPDPKYLFNAKGYVTRTVLYANTPDLFIFDTMLANHEYDPLKMKQYSQYIEWTYAEPGYIALGAELNSTSYQIPTYVVMFKYEEADHKIEKLGNLLVDKYGFNIDNLTYYYVYHR